jgi:predicted HTH domain antitoxin
MQITIELPEEIGHQLQQNWGNLPQKTLESLALEAYRQGMITSAQIQNLLQLSSRWQTEQFLKENQAYLDYTEEDLANDLKTLNQLLPE